MSGDPFDAAFGVTAAKPRAVALDGNNTGGINDGPFARSQPGYKGANGRYAAFETPEHGLAAQRALLASYVQRGFDTPAKIAARWAPGSDGNNPSAYAATVARQMGIGVGDKITPAQLDAFAHAQAKVENSAYVPPAAAIDPNDPFDVAFAGGNVAGNGKPSDSAGGGGARPNVPGNLAGNSVGMVPPQGAAPAAAGGANNRQNGNAQGGAGSRGFDYGAAATQQALNRNPLFRGIEDVSNTVLKYGASGLDAVLPNKWAGGFNARDLIDAGIKSNETRYQAARGPDAGIDAGRIGGQIVATAPVGAVRALAAVPALARGGMLARSVARVGDAALQGGAGAFLASSASDNPGADTALGAGLGGAIGLASPLAGRAVSMLGPKLAAGLERVGLSKPGVVADAPGMVGAARPRMATAAPTPEQLAAGLTTGGARRGLISNPNLTPEMKAQIGMLVGKGVPLDQAIREVEAKAIGAAPTTPQVTRNFHDQYAANEGAKIDTPAGRELSARNTANNAAAHQAVAGLIESYGGIPDKGAAMNDAATALAVARDAERAKVSRLYDAAAAEHGYTAPQSIESNIDAPQPPAPKPYMPKIDVPDEYSVFGDAVNTRNANGKIIRRKAPMDMITYLRARGGLADFKGELQSLGLDNKARNLDFARNEMFYGPLLSENGQTLDAAANDAWTAGYMPHLTERPSVSEFLDALRGTHHGYDRAFSAEDQDILAQFDEMQRARYGAEQEAELRASTEGFSPAGEIPKEHLPPLSAYESDFDMMGGAVTARPLIESFDSLEMKAPVTAAGKSFASGIRRATAILSENGKKGLTPASLERLRQMANAAYDPMGGEVNRLVGKTKGEIDRLFDELGDASPAYKAARQAHQQWAQKWEAPGVEDVARRDAKGNFVNDPYKAETSILANKDPRAFANIIDRLRDTGKTEIIDRLKASVIQDAYEAVTRGAPDAGGNTLLNGQRFLAELDKLGHRKLAALFTPDELGKIAAIGRGAMHVNVPVAGAGNSSGTSSALLNALKDGQARAAGGNLKSTVGIHTALAAVGQGIGHLVAPGAGGAVAGAAGNAAKLAADALRTRSGNKAIASALSEISNPETARAAAAARSAALAKQLRATRAGQNFARLAAGGAVTANGVK